MSDSRKHWRMTGFQNQWFIDKQMRRKIGKFEIEGGGMCPEQYNVYLDGEEIAYLRLRHGHFTAEMPIGGVLVHTAHPKGDGCFDDDERDWHIQNAIASIEFAMLFGRSSLSPYEYIKHKNTKTFNGKRFNVTIDRSEMERRYVLRTIDENDSSTKEENEPMRKAEFEKHFGFSPEWPHKTIKQQ